MPDEASNGRTGEIEVNAGIKEFELAIIATADKKLTGNEQLTLSLGLFQVLRRMPLLKQRNYLRSVQV